MDVIGTHAGLGSQAVSASAATDEVAGSRPFETVYRSYAPYVATIGFRILGNSAEVDDLVQDVFIEAHRSLDRLRNKNAIKGWLATVTVRMARRRLRWKKARRFVGLDILTYDADYASSELSPEDAAQLSAVYGILERISVEQRLAWTLRHALGESMERVAELCGCSVSTAKRRVTAAHKTIQRRLVTRANRPKTSLSDERSADKEGCSWTT